MEDFIVSLMLLGAMSTGGGLPFWAAANRYGLMPEGNGFLSTVGAYTQYDESKTFQWKWGVSIGESYDFQQQTSRFLPDELYASAKWNVFSLDLGMKHHKSDYLAPGLRLGDNNSLGSLSTTGGNIIWSGNSRAFPGYTINLDPVAIPFTGNHLSIYGAFGDYATFDNRWCKGALIHNTKVALKLNFLEHWEFHFGLDHYAMWGGTCPDGSANVRLTFENYCRMVLGMHAGDDGTFSDRMNVIGDQGGGEFLTLEYSNDDFRFSAKHDIPYSDGSGMGFQNFPDGVNTLFFGFADKDRWVSDILYEYIYTMYQSGPLHFESFDEDGNSTTPPGSCTTGMDNYFNNGEYRSGWTYYGRTIGLPLFYPNAPDESGITLGVRNNRLKAHHIGLAGKLFRKAPYKLMLTYSKNYGTYSEPYTGECAAQKPWGSVVETPFRQISAAFTGEVPVPVRNGHQIDILYGIYADKGQVLEDNAGFTLGLRYFFCR